jgi:L-fucose isomerase-like protein
VQPTHRVGFLPIGRKRGGFNPEWGRQMQNAAREAIDSIALQVASPTRPVVDDGTLREAIGELRKAGCDTLLVLQPTMGDGRLAPVLAQLWSEPVVLWATPEKRDDPRVSSCSLTGAHDFAAIMRQFGHGFELLYGHPEEEQTRQKLLRAVRVTATAKSLPETTLGLVGGTAPGFIDMQADPAVLSRLLGVGLVQMGLRELHTAMDEVDDGALQDDLRAVQRMELPLDDGLGPEDLRMNSRYYLAMKSMMRERSLDALAVRCWPELPNVYGQWPYLAMARMLEEGLVVALEGDADAALGCLVAQQLGMGESFIADWLEHNEDWITFWHPGQAPPSMCVPDSLSLGMHFNIEKPLVLNGRLRPAEPVTVYRMWRCDGQYHLTARQGRSVPPRRELMGADVTVELPGINPDRWFEALCHAGMPHHVAVTYGHHAESLRRLARLIGIEWTAAEC